MHLRRNPITFSFAPLSAFPLRLSRKFTAYLPLIVPAMLLLNVDSIPLVNKKDSPLGPSLKSIPVLDPVRDGRYRHPKHSQMLDR